MIAGVAVTPFEELKRYVGFDRRDAELLANLHAAAGRRLDEVPQVFYDRLLQSDGARAVLQDRAQVERLKKTLRRWTDELLTGPHDEDYHARRCRIGEVHVRIGVPHRYINAAMSVVRTELCRIAREVVPPEDLWDTCIAVQKATDLDLAIMTASFMDIREEQELRNLRNLIVQHIPGSVIVLNAQREIAAASGSPCPEATGLQAHLPPGLAEICQIEALIDRRWNRPGTDELPHVRVPGPDGDRVFRVTLMTLEHPLARMLIHVEELTATARAEARARQAEALARIGTLAANVAHEIRNPLAAIASTLQVLAATLDLDPRRRAIMEKVHGQVLRLDRLVSDLLGFARTAEPRLGRTDLAVAAREALQQSAVPTELEVLRPAPAMADGQMVVQILVNLLQNAADAAGPEGTIRLRVGPGSTLEVEDDGPGIPPDQRERVFEPFVTTKAAGTGLGLAICRRLASAMDGNLTVEEGSAGGALFRLVLNPWRSARISPADTAGRTG